MLEIDTRDLPGIGRLTWHFLNTEDVHNAGHYLAAYAFDGSTLGEYRTDDAAEARECFLHPGVYIPLEGHRSDSEATGGSSPAPESNEITERVAQLVQDVAAVYRDLGESDYRWLHERLEDIAQAIYMERFR